MSTRVIVSPLGPPSLETSGELFPNDERFRLLANGWNRAVCYDETVFPAPHTYDPERFLKDGKLNSSVMDPEESIFGSGRRCVLGVFTHRRQFLKVTCPTTGFAPVDISPFGLYSSTSPVRSLCLISRLQQVRSSRQSTKKAWSGKYWFPIHTSSIWYHLQS